MGKYSNVIDNLPKARATKAEYDGSDYQSRVDEVKPLILAQSKTSSELAMVIRELRETKDSLDKELSQVNLKLEAVAQLLIDAYEADDIESIKLGDGVSISVQSEPQIRILDRSLFRQWCIANGFEEEMVLPYQTSNAIVKERLLEGQPEPEGVTTIARHKIVVRGR